MAVCINYGYSDQKYYCKVYVNFIVVALHSEWNITRCVSSWEESIISHQDTLSCDPGNLKKAHSH